MDFVTGLITGVIIAGSLGVLIDHYRSRCEYYELDSVLLSIQLRRIYGEDKKA